MNALTLGANPLIIGGAGATTISGLIAGTVANGTTGLTIGTGAGSGTVVSLTNNANTFTGDIAINGGTLVYSQGTATTVSQLGRGAAAAYKQILLTNGGTFRVSTVDYNVNTPTATNLSAGQVFNIGTGGGTFQVDSGCTFIIDDGTGAGTALTASQLQGSGILTKTGLGVLSLGNSTVSNAVFTGQILVNNGVLRTASLTTGVAFGSTGANTVISSGAALDLGISTSTTAEPVTISGTGAGALALYNAAAGNGTNAIYSSGATASSFAGPITLAAASTIGAGAAGTMTLSGGVTGAHALTINNLNAGGTTFSTAAVNNTGTITNSGAGAGTTNVNLAFGSNVTGINQSSATSGLTLNATNGVAMVVGAIPINITAGTLSYVFNGTNTATANILGTGTITITPGATLALSVGSVTDTLANTIAIPNTSAGISTISTSGGITFNSAATVTFAAGSFTPTLRLTNTNGAAFGLNLQGAVSGPGNLQLNASGTTTGPVITVSGAQNQTGTISNIGATAGTTALTTLSGPIGSGITAISQAGINPFTVSASVPLSATLNSFTSTGAGLWTFSNASTFTGTQPLAFNANSTGGITVSGTNLNHTGTVTNSGTNIGVTTISSAIGGNVTNLVQNSATSNLVLSGTNTYTGSSNATLGLLQFSNVASLPNFGTGSQGAITVGNGGILGLGYAGANQFTQANVTSILSGTLPANNVTWAATGSSIGLDTSTASASYTPVIANPSGTTSFGLVKLGTNTLTLGTANTFSGPVAIRNGTLSAGSLNSVTTPSPVGASSLGVPSSIPNGTISLGFLTTTGILSYTGASETTDRVIDLAGTTGGGGITNAGSGTLTFSSPMTFTGTGVKNLTFAGASNITFGGAIGTSNNLSTGTSALQITKSDAGTVTLSGANFARNLIISGGILDTGAGSLTLSNTGANTIDASANATINGNIILAGVGGAGNGADIGAIAGGVTLTINANISGGATNNIDFWSSITGVTILNGANTWSGLSRVAGQIVQVASLNSVVGGTASSNFGAPTTVPNGTIGLSGGATLRYAGTGEITDRVINLDAATTGGIIEQSGTNLLKFTSNFTATANGAKVLTLQGSTAGTGEISGAIVNSTGTTGITKAGTGTWTLSGANTYTGNTNVNAGKLVLTTGTTNNSLVTVNAGAILDVTGNYTIGNTATAAAGGRLTLTAGSTLDLTDGAINTLTVLGNAFVGNSLTLNGGNIVFDLSTAGTNDLIDVRSGAGVPAAATGQATSTGTVVLSFNPLGGSLTTGTFPLIRANAGSSTLNPANFVLASPNLVLGGTTYNLSLSGTAGSESLIVASGGALASAALAYWQGTQGDGKWNTIGAGSTTNWGTTASGTPDTFAVPDLNTNVIFTANAATNLSTTLEQAFTVNSLSFSGQFTANSAGSTIASGTGTNALTINAAAINGNASGNGINVLAGSGANTISTNVILGASQTWTNNSTNSLTVSGVVSEGSAGLGLTKAGTGTIVLSNSANTYTGPTTINGGVLSVSTLASGASPSGIGQSAATASNLVFGGTGSLQYTGSSVAIDRAFTINAGSTATIDVTQASTTLSLPGATGVTTTGILTKTGAGALTLTGADVRTGNTVVSGGT